MDSISKKKFSNYCLLLLLLLFLLTMMLLFPNVVALDIKVGDFVCFLVLFVGSFAIFFCVYLCCYNVCCYLLSYCDCYCYVNECNLRSWNIFISLFLLLLLFCYLLFSPYCSSYSNNWISNCPYYDYSKKLSTLIFIIWVSYIGQYIGYNFLILLRPVILLRSSNTNVLPDVVVCDCSFDDYSLFKNVKYATYYCDTLLEKMTLNLYTDFASTFIAYFY